MPNFVVTSGRSTGHVLVAPVTTEIASTATIGATLYYAPGIGKFALATALTARMSMLQGPTNESRNA